MLRRRTRPPSLIDLRTGLIRWILDLPTDPGEPSIFNCSVKMADTHRYSSAPCYDNNGGAALTLEEAHQAAVGEGVERYCGGIYDPDHLIFGSAHSVGERHPVVAPGRFALFHPRQQGNFPAFNDETPIAWVWGYSLSRRVPVLAPACLVYMPYRPHFADQGECVIAPAVSTGQACAPSHDLALVKGICEAVEHDAFMIGWLNRLPVARVDFASSAAVRKLYSERLKRPGLTYLLFDITTDIPIPSFLCVLIDEGRSPAMIGVGGASGLDPEHAAAKALIEAVQTREWAKFLRRRDQDFSFKHDFSDIHSFEDHVALYAYGDMRRAIDFLFSGHTVSATDYWRSRRTGDLAADLKQAVAALDSAGLEAIAFDLTTPDVAECGYCVTKVLVPGLQPLYADHALPFLGGTRLYEVPRRLGYTAAETCLDELNPYPHPYP